MPFPQDHQGVQIIAFCAAQLSTKAKRELTSQYGRLEMSQLCIKGSWNVLKIQRLDWHNTFLATFSAWTENYGRPFGTSYWFSLVSKQTTPIECTQARHERGESCTPSGTYMDYDRGKDCKTCGMVFGWSPIAQGDGASPTRTMRRLTGRTGPCT